MIKSAMKSNNVQGEFKSITNRLAGHDKVLKDALIYIASFTFNPKEPMDMSMMFRETYDGLALEGLLDVQTSVRNGEEVTYVLSHFNATTEAIVREIIFDVKDIVISCNQLGYEYSLPLAYEVVVTYSTTTVKTYTNI